MSEVPTWVRSPYSGQQSWPSEVPIWVRSPNSDQQSRPSEVPTRVRSPHGGVSFQRHNSFIRTPNQTFHICFFYRLEERNVMVKSVTYFDNFIKWTFFLLSTRSNKECKRRKLPNKIWYEYECTEKTTLFRKHKLYRQQQSARNVRNRYSVTRSSARRRSSSITRCIPSMEHSAVVFWG
jgi:hypothetical protein